MYQLIKEKKIPEKIGIDSFKFYKKIGEGAFGEVYIVKKGKSEQLYALKAIKKQKVIGSNILRYIQT
jgi:serine/threonine protein kinase